MDNSSVQQWPTSPTPEGQGRGASPPQGTGGLACLLLFGGTVFLGAALLFLVEPLVGRLLLPRLGGSPSVWNTCLFFFQAVLLAGYACAHWATTRLRSLGQLGVQTALCCAGLAALPLGLGGLAGKALEVQGPPVWVVTLGLAALVGLPFLALSMTGPLVQRWFSLSGHARAQDPYFLYVASNAGSLAGLLAYPLLVEPWLRLARQSSAWTVLYGVWGALIVACGVWVWRASRGLPKPVSAGSPATARAAEPAEAASVVNGRLRVQWMLLAFVPASLLMGVTTFLSTDIAPLPLLWVVPLAVYLVTFMVAFSRAGAGWGKRAERAAPAGVVAIAFLMLIKATEPLLVLVLVHLGVFLLLALVCHGRLAALRPAPVHLTEYYLLISVGGVLASGFTVLAAPLLFRQAFEYPLSLVLACLAGLGWGRSERRFRATDGLLPLALGITVGLGWLGWHRWSGGSMRWAEVLLFGLAVLVVYFWSERAWRFGLAVLGLLLLGSLLPDSHGRTLYRERNFFGISRVTLDPTGSFHRILHGNTLHGRQRVDPARQCEPVGYYHRLGPVGDVFGLMHTRPERRNVGIIGLGAGGLLAYSQPGEDWTIYEIDPAVARIARDPKLFTYTSACCRGRLSLVMGDARLRLQAAAPQAHDVLILDAFSSDAIPTHLLTREAVQLYLSRIKPGGVLVFHISNRSLELEPVVAAIAGDLGLTCAGRFLGEVSEEQATDGLEPSHWVVLAKDPALVAPILERPGWRVVPPQPGRQPWTDDFIHVLGALRWR